MEERDDSLTDILQSSTSTQGCSAAFSVVSTGGGGGGAASGRQGPGQEQAEGVALVAEVREVVTGKGATQAYQGVVDKIFQAGGLCL